MDIKLPLKPIDKGPVPCDIMIIGEAFAQDQAVESGIPYFYNTDNISDTGARLEEFLKRLNCTLYPEREKRVYSTEIFHASPTKGNSIRKPTSVEIEEDLKTNRLKVEIERVKPKFIFLFGATSYESFYKYFHIKTKTARLNLTEKIKNLCETEKFDRYEDIFLIPIFHSSGQNIARFRGMLKNERLFEVIKKIMSN